MSNVKKAVAAFLTAIAVCGLTACAAERESDGDSLVPEYTVTTDSNDNLGGGGESTNVGNVADVQDTVSAAQGVIDGQTELGEATTEIEDGAYYIMYSQSEALITDENGKAAQPDGVSVSGAYVTVETGGTYVLSGHSADGKLIVATKQDVHIILNGVNLTCATGSPLSMFKSSEKTVTLASGTKNSLTDAAEYTVFHDAADPDENGALFATKALTINGSGKLDIVGNYKNGISCKDKLTVLGGEITVNAVNSGIKGNDAVILGGGTLDIVSGGDGIKSDNADTDEANAALGYVYVYGGTANITAGGDGIQADKLLVVSGGTLNVVSGGGSTATVGEDSCKGIKSDADIVVSGGAITVDACDDSVHANGNIVISGGTLSLSTGDDGVHADGTLDISGEQTAINVLKSYEGIEGQKIRISGGTVNVVASDDGVNASSDSDIEMVSNDDDIIEISGGALTVNAGGDGLDSNGCILISGGITVVYGPVDGANASLDSEGGIRVTGGTLAALGGLGMVETPTRDSTQPSVSFTFASNQSADTSLTMLSDGAQLFTFTAEKSYRSLIFSCPDFKIGSTYTLEGDGVLAEFTLNSVITSVSLGGNAAQGGGQGGQGGQGGGFGRR